MPHHAFDARTHARMFHPEHLGLIDPFIGVDLFHMPHNFFLPHPHGGMSAVTLLLDDSPGGVINRDSRGDHSTIQPVTCTGRRPAAASCTRKPPASRAAPPSACRSS